MLGSPRTLHATISTNTKLFSWRCGNDVLIEISLEDATDIRIRDVLLANFEQGKPSRADISLSKRSCLLHKSDGETCQGAGMVLFDKGD